MSTVLSLKSLAATALLFSGLGLCGCYDLGDPTGPTAADFEAQKNAANATTAEDDDTEAPDTAPTPVASLEREALPQKVTATPLLAQIDPSAQK